MDLNEYCTQVTLWIYLDVFKWNKECATKLTQKLV